MEARLVREELQKCYRGEGVNHNQNCKELADRYIGMIRDNKVSYHPFAGCLRGVRQSSWANAVRKFVLRAAAAVEASARGRIWGRLSITMLTLLDQGLHRHRYRVDHRWDQAEEMYHYAVCTVLGQWIRFASQRHW